MARPPLRKVATKVEDRCSDGMGLKLTSVDGQVVWISCELELGHDGDHANARLTWPQADWFDMTGLPKDIQEMIRCIPVLIAPAESTVVRQAGDPSPNLTATGFGLDTLGLLKWLTAVFCVGHEVVETDPGRALREVLELREELRSGVRGVDGREVAAIGQVDVVAGQ